jgi:hypothetical protein
MRQLEERDVCAVKRDMYVLSREICMCCQERYVCAVKREMYVLSRESSCEFIFQIDFCSA